MATVSAIAMLVNPSSLGCFTVVAVDEITHESTTNTTEQNTEFKPEQSDNETVPQETTI